MPRRSFPKALLALAVIAAGATYAPAQKRADQLTQAELREHVLSYLATDKGKAQLKNLTPLANLDIERLTYGRGMGNNFLVKWVVTPRKPLLTMIEREQIKVGVEALLIAAIDQHLVGGNKLLRGGITRLDFDVVIAAPQTPPERIPTKPERLPAQPERIPTKPERTPTLPQPRPEKAPPSGLPGTERLPRARSPEVVYSVSYVWCPYNPPYWGVPCPYQGVSLGGYWVPVYGAPIAGSSASAATTSAEDAVLAAIRRMRRERAAETETAIRASHSEASRREKTEKAALEAVEYFWRGYRLYWQRDYAGALEYFDAAVERDREDARFWYYKGLAELSLGKQDAASRAIARGAELQHEMKPNAVQIGNALERVQGPERALIRAALERDR
jgi:hypothetical protein